MLKIPRFNEKTAIYPPKKGFFCILLHRRYTYSTYFNTDSRTFLPGIRLTATELKETCGLRSEKRPRSGHEPREEYC